MTASKSIRIFKKNSLEIISDLRNICKLRGCRGDFFKHLPFVGLSFSCDACMLSHSVVSDSLQSLWTVTLQAPLPMGFSKQEF